MPTSSISVSASMPASTMSGIANPTTSTVVSAPAPVNGNPIKAYTDSIAARLGTGSVQQQQNAMTSSVRILDEGLQWHETLADYLLPDNNGFLVVGVLGKKGTGKSTLMSLLASGGDAHETVFRVNSDLASHCTSGVSAFITCERTILLDVQVEHT